MVDIILQLKPNKKTKDLSMEAAALFGVGGYTQEQFDAWEAEGVKIRTENLLGHVNTPMSVAKNGDTFVMIRIDDEYASQIETIGETLSAKWWAYYDPENPVMIEVDDYDMDGNVIGTRMQEIGKIA